MINDSVVLADADGRPCGTADREGVHGVDTPLPCAPELCIEMLSPLNRRAQLLDKVTAYLAAGAREVWLVDEDGSLEILTAQGAQTRSSLGLDIKLPT